MTCPLNERERAVAQLSADGAQINEIALVLHFSSRTVKEILRQAREATETRTTTHLVAHALRKRWIR